MSAEVSREERPWEVVNKMMTERERDDVDADDDRRAADEKSDDVTPEEEERGVTVEEESEQSFPASDPPSY